MLLVQHTVKVKSPEDVGLLCQAYRTAVTHAATQNAGSLVGRCFVNLNDPLVVLFHEHWGSLADVQRWQASIPWQHFIKQARPHLASSIDSSTFEVQESGGACP